MKLALAPALLALLAVAGCGPSSADDVRPATPSETRRTPGELPIAERGPTRDRFIPPTYVEGDRVVVPITFPDGSTAEVVYPRELDLASLGVQPSTWARLEGPLRAVGRDLLIQHGEAKEIWTGAPIAVYGGSEGGAVPLYATADRADYLVFQFGSWTVSVYDYAPTGELADARMTEEERTTWAASLVGHETPEGFLVLEARPPLRLARPGEYPAPMAVWLGEQANGLVIWPTTCSKRGNEVERSATYASWCDVGASMYVGAQGERAFIDAVARARPHVRNVHLAG